MAVRINGLSTERLRASEITSSASLSINGGSTIKSRRRAFKPLSFIESAHKAINFAFEHDLVSSRVYRRALPSDHPSMTSLTSSALYTTAMSLFSHLSLSQVSNISFYALPVYCTDLSHSELYVFGDQGVPATLLPLRSDSSTASPPPDRPSADLMAPHRGKEFNVTDRPRAGPRLLGRFARRQPDISAPDNPVHVTHVRYDADIMEFTVQFTLIKCLEKL